MRYKDEEIAQLVSSINDMATIFKEMSTLVAPIILIKKSKATLNTAINLFKKPDSLIPIIMSKIPMQHIKKATKSGY